MFLSQLFESTIKHASFCFGRMNPPTLGHGQLIDTVAQAAQGGDYFVFASGTQDKKKNPLDYATKIKFLRALFPEQASHIVNDPTLKTIMQVAEWLYAQGYRSVTFVAGSDRLDSFKQLLTSYNGVEGKDVYYKFDAINFVSSGERDPDADGIAGISASGAREAAVNSDINAFAQATGAGKLTQPLYDAVRKGMLLEGLHESFPEVYSNIVDAAINARRKGKKVVKSAGGYYKVTDKTDLATEIVPNEEYLLKQRTIIARVKTIDFEIIKNFERPFGQERVELAHSLPIDPKTNRFINVDDWVNGLDKLRQKYFAKEYDDLETEKRKLRTELKILRKTEKAYTELAECSGYIPKNKKEAKDPRWSNSLTVDIKPGAINKNLKALRLI